MSVPHLGSLKQYGAVNTYYHDYYQQHGYHCLDQHYDYYDYDDYFYGHYCLCDHGAP